jgi:hypothetical protein
MSGFGAGFAFAGDGIAELFELGERSQELVCQRLILPEHAEHKMFRFIWEAPNWLASKRAKKMVRRAVSV